MELEERLRLACLLAIMHDLESNGADAAELEGEIWCLRHPEYEYTGVPTVWSEMSLKDLLRVIARTPNREHLMGLVVCTSKQL